MTTMTKPKPATTTAPPATPGSLAALARGFDEASRAFAAATAAAAVTAAAHEAATRERNAAITYQQEQIQRGTYGGGPPAPARIPLPLDEAIAAEQEAAAANKEAHRELAAAESARARLGTLVAQAMHAKGVRFALLRVEGSPDRLLIDESKHYEATEQTLIDMSTTFSGRRGIFTRASEWSARIVVDLIDADDIL
jgi:hypothetical protein